MVMGATDTGKTCLAFSLAERLAAEGLKVGMLDCDLGQSSIGPPCTVGLQYPLEKGQDLLHPTAMVFLGHLSPAGDVGSMIDAGLRLEKLAVELECDLLLIDTSGMVEGGLAALLKRGKIRKLRPDLIISLDEAGETRHIFKDLEESAYGQLEFVKPSAEARPRGRRERSDYRGELFREYYKAAGELELDLSEISLVPVSNRIPADPGFLQEGHLLGLNDKRGLTLSLAILQKRDDRIIALRSPFKGEINQIESVVVGPYKIDAEGRTTLVRS
jgi:polynucleotide 5'-hydroxyl-kinase GRC3/NOL9